MSPIVLPLIATVAAPAGLALWMASPRLATRLDGILVALGSGAYLLFALAAGSIWGWIGLGWRWALVGIWLLSLIVMLSRWRALPWRPHGGLRAWADVASKSFFVLITALLVSQVALGYRQPAESIDLTFPLGPGRYLVLNGGASAAINGHHGVTAQSLALDIIALGPDGRRAEGLDPTRLAAYDIYGVPVLAPCAGEVIDASDTAPDEPIGDADPEDPAGNYLTLACTIDGTPVSVLLAHFEPGSLMAKTGDRVEPGMALARVGNSGNTSEPHLHIHAVQGRVTDHTALITDADPIGLRFDGRTLRRNGVVVEE